MHEPGPVGLSEVKSVIPGVPAALIHPQNLERWSFRPDTRGCFSFIKAHPTPFVNALWLLGVVVGEFRAGVYPQLGFPLGHINLALLRKAAGTRG